MSNQSNYNYNPLLSSYKMFCILKKSKFSTHLFSNVLNNNSVYKDPSRVTMKGYSRLCSNEDEPNGNTAFQTNMPSSSSSSSFSSSSTSCTSSSSTISFASFSSSASSSVSSSSSSFTSSSNATTASSTNRLCSITTLGLTEPDAGSIGSASVVESSSEQDIYMSQTEDDEEDDEGSDDDDDALTCNVCDRSFPTTRDLATHQTRKRHYGCSTCENVFPTLMSLEFHKEETKHWSDENYFLDSGNDDDDDDEHFYEEDDDAEREKLL
ncbi:uncharacterized protein LOC143026659 isoform X3 [Oratosquilla oratoria]|uniref:uncharacterized protein LOC143026659 isoform X3 n=1 Tax=Oratosquilla oratoria TaxID=337810 RepID=UPI003F76BB16